MKTTLNVRDDLYRKAKARAALQGKTLGRFLEESLERMLRDNPPDIESWSEWAQNLPTLSRSAVRDLEQAVAAPNFRAVDPEMWQ
ncbi:MAG: hypothetical protein KOO61_04875 [Spirochaetales bacterium]|nr:hypothetical protein [Spirochaetales bacterium]